jgi:hypothetical protein
VCCAAPCDVQSILIWGAEGVARLAPGGPRQGRARRWSRGSGAAGAALIYIRINSAT